MAKALILFNLKPGVSVQDYENWARKSEIPTVNGLKSVANFEAFKTAGLMFSDGEAPYAYAEILDIHDMNAFEKEIQLGKMKQVAVRFEDLVDNPQYINLEMLK